MTPLQFYSDLNTLVENATKGGVDMLTIIEDLRLLATVMEALNVPQSNR